MSPLIPSTMNILLVFLPLLAAVYGQVPTPCTPPQIFEARELKVDRSTQNQRLAKISVDEVNRRVRRVEELRVGDTTDYFDELFLHNEDRFYRLNLKTRVCNVSRPEHEWHSYGIPNIARFEGENYVGASVANEGVLVTRWSGTFTDGDLFFGAWTQPGCFPVILDSYDQAKKEFTSRNFFDITVGISNPNVFVPPTECLQAQMLNRLKYRPRH